MNILCNTFYFALNRTAEKYNLKITKCMMNSGKESPWWLTVQPLESCLLMSAWLSRSFDMTLTLPSLQAYINGDIWYLKKKITGDLNTCKKWRHDIWNKHIKIIMKTISWQPHLTCKYTSIYKNLSGNWKKVFHPIFTYVSVECAKQWANWKIYFQ